MKLKLILAYDGSKFQGSATQPHKNSVQDHLASALAHLGIFNKPLFASRTDKGVHALANVASVECGEHFDDLNYLLKQMNKFAQPALNIKAIFKVQQDFEPRFHAKAREYIYIFNHNKFSPFLAPYTLFYPKFDLQKANEALKLFVGEHDFALFQKQSDKNSVKTIFQARAFRHKNYSFFKFKANGFLRGQIRLSTAIILKHLENKLSLDQIQAQINTQTTHSTTLAPACGLYLSRVFYEGV